VVKKARSTCEVAAIFGRVRKLPALSSADGKQRSEAERQAINSMVQGSAADILVLAMLGVDRSLRKAGLDAAIVLAIHDEIVVETAAVSDTVQQVCRILAHHMQQAADLECPLPVKIEVRATLGDMKEAEAC